MFKFAICDDELDVAESFSKMIEKNFQAKKFDATIVSVTDSQDIIYEKIRKNEIDVLFLDIDFKNSSKNGLEFAKDLRKINKDFYLVFLTAHLRYMHMSFISKTYDYLVKPINQNVLEEFTNRLIDELKLEKSMFLHLNKGLMIKIKSILYIEKIENKCEIYTLNGKFSSTITLEKISNMLPCYFKKCHRSYIINTLMIDTFDKPNNLVTFENGLSCPTNSHFRLED